MTAPVPNLDRPHAWFFTSELEGQRAGSFRQERWCRIFLEAGAQIHTFNQRGAFSISSRVFSDDAAFMDYRRTEFARARPMASVREGLTARTLRRIKHWLMPDLYYPNIFGLIFRGIARLARTDKPVLLMCSSPPFSLALAGAVLKRIFPGRLHLHVDMRDAWALHTSLGGCRALKRLIERAVLRTADSVTTVSYGLKEEFEAHYGISVNVLYNVATHYFDEDPTPLPLDWRDLNPSIRDDSLKLVYTGSTPEGFYDLRGIVGAMRKFRAENAELASRIQLVFVGACQEVEREIERQGGVGDSIVMVGHVRNDLVRNIQKNADALIFLAYSGEGNKGVVSTKIFEYLALGKPILPLSLTEGADVDRLLVRYCGTTANYTNSADFTRCLAAISESGVCILPVAKERGAMSELLNGYRTFAANHLYLD